MNQNLTYNIECTILNTFLEAEKNICVYNHNEIEYFNMESEYFSTDLNKLICSKLIDAINKGDSISLLGIKIESWIIDKQPHLFQQWVNIRTTTNIPLSASKKYYDEIKINEVRRRLKIDG